MLQGSRSYDASGLLVLIFGFPGAKLPADVSVFFKGLWDSRAAPTQRAGVGVCDYVSGIQECLVGVLAEALAYVMKRHIFRFKIVCWESIRAFGKAKGL